MPPQNKFYSEAVVDPLAHMYEVYADDLYAYGLSILPDINMIEDAIHDVFIDIYANEARLNKIDNIGLYLKTAFRNRLFLLLKKSRRFVDIIKDMNDLADEKDSQSDWIRNEEDENRLQLVNGLLSGLTIHQREAIHLRFIEGLSLDEISAILRINKRSVKSLLQRAIQKIRKNVEKFPVKVQ